MERSGSLNVIFSKALNTVQAQCNELYLEKLADKIESHYEEVSIKFSRVKYNFINRKLPRLL